MPTADAEGEEEAVLSPVLMVYRYIASPSSTTAMPYRAVAFLSRRRAMFVVVDEAVGSASDSVGTPVVVMVEMDVPAISCEAAGELVPALPIVLALLPVLVLTTGGSDVESANVLRIGSCALVDAVA